MSNAGEQTSMNPFKNSNTKTTSKNYSEFINYTAKGKMKDKLEPNILLFRYIITYKYKNFIIFLNLCDKADKAFLEEYPNAAGNFRLEKAKTNSADLNNTDFLEYLKNFGIGVYFKRDERTQDFKLTIEQNSALPKCRAELLAYAIANTPTDEVKLTEAQEFMHKLNLLCQSDIVEFEMVNTEIY